MSTGDPLQLVEVGVSWPPETFLRWKFSALAERGFEVTVATCDVYDPEFELPGASVFALPEWREPFGQLLRRLLRDCLWLLFRAPRRLLGLIRAMRRADLKSPARARSSFRREPWVTVQEELAWWAVFAPLARLRPDIVHFEWESTATRYLPIVAAWGCPMVMSCHGGLEIWSASPAHATIVQGLPRAFAHAAAVQCVSRVERAQALEHGLAPDKAHLLPCGVDPDRFSPPAVRRRGDALRVIAVGWLRWLKGYEFAVQTVRELLDLGVPVRLDVFGGDPPPAVGEPSERPRIIQALEDLGLEQHVFLRGHVPTETLVEHYRAADALLHSSVSEGVPVAILEAMATELPVVATDCGGVRDAVRDGVDGFVTPTRDPAAAAAALARLWNEPELGAEMGRTGRQRVRSRFTLERQLKGLEALYRGLEPLPRG